MKKVAVIGGGPSSAYELEQLRRRGKLSRYTGVPVQDLEKELQRIHFKKSRLPAAKRSLIIEFFNLNQIEP